MKHQSFYIFIVAGIVLDQLSKYAIKLWGTHILTPFFSIVHAWNPGVGWGFFPCTTRFCKYLLIAIELSLLALLQQWFIQSRNFLEKLGIVLIITGAFGNLIDRLVFGAVFDFLDLHWMSWHFPAFNVADIFISMGFLILMKETLWSGQKKSE